MGAAMLEFNSVARTGGVDEYHNLRYALYGRTYVEENGFYVSADTGIDGISYCLVKFAPKQLQRVSGVWRIFRVNELTFKCDKELSLNQPVQGFVYLELSHDAFPKIL